MTSSQAEQGTLAPAKSELDETDRTILRVLQHDATLSLDRVAKKVSVSKTAVWNRIQRMQQAGVIVRQAVIIDPVKAGLAETFYISVRTSQHSAAWLDKFSTIVAEMPEIMEAHRLAGDIDYLIKVQVSSTRAFDEFYKRLVSQIDLFNVTSSLSMEVMKHETALPI